MSNFQKPTGAAALVQTPEAKESDVQLIDYLRRSELASFYGAVYIMRNTRICLRYWFTADFAYQFDKNGPGDRCDNYGRQSYRYWKDLNTMMDSVVMAACQHGDKETFARELTQIVENTIGPRCYDKAELARLRNWVHDWFNEVPRYWENNGDECTSFDHAVSFNYIDGLLTLLLDYHQDLLTGKPQ